MIQITAACDQVGCNYEERVPLEPQETFSKVEKTLIDRGWVFGRSAAACPSCAGSERLQEGGATFLEALSRVAQKHPGEEFTTRQLVHLVQEAGWRSRAYNKRTSVSNALYTLFRDGAGPAWIQKVSAGYGGRKVNKYKMLGGVDASAQ